jgi:hypothetical protein
VQSGKQEKGLPNIVKRLILEGPCHPDAETECKHEKSHKEVEADEEKHLTSGRHEIVELNDVDNLPPPEQYKNNSNDIGILQGRLGAERELRLRSDSRCVTIKGPSILRVNG